MLSSSFGFATCVIMDVLSMETRCCAPLGCTALFFGDHHPARCYSYGPPAVYRLLLRAPLKSHFTGTVQVPSAQKHWRGRKKNSSGRWKRTKDRFQTWSDSADVQETNKSVSPALKPPYVSSVVAAAAGSIAPAFCRGCSCCCCYCALRLQSTHYNINCVIWLQCLPRDGDRPPACHRLALHNNAPPAWLWYRKVHAE